MKQDHESHFGFKRITDTSWKEPDFLNAYEGYTEQTWIAATLKPQLSLTVPEKVRALFEMARALYVYSWYFYPMATMGAEQLHRVLEAAAREKCSQLNLAPHSKSTRSTSFSSNIERLINAAAINQADKDFWDSSRQLRNSSSHPKSPVILTPSMTLGVLVHHAQMLNRLFR